jgi:hypothetical protein
MLKRRKTIILLCAVTVMIPVLGGLYLRRMLVAPVTAGDYGIPSGCRVEASRAFSESEGSAIFSYHYQRMSCDTDPKLVRQTIENYIRILRDGDTDGPGTGKFRPGADGRDHYINKLKTQFMPPSIPTLPANDVWILDWPEIPGIHITIYLWGTRDGCVVEVVEVGAAYDAPD